ncbi:DUF669 domain-containing protein [Aurantimonas endophytica]|uniref:DUF669 domain-containing protein n=1 Tax=Aurantimonas endophytica TaxID=1522175 RepID=A0A7W6HGD2_9HYPH|nr:DUF669 domain-containing protein [Aurantimonas endophytica]MBB4004453.1 hypothetical protein [Aurantimonas endophytica]MCO6405289.1 DUF669 domain-containing protein [Aurantimonas endophytica]
MVNIAGYNAADHEPTGEFERIPEGRYHAEIVNSEEKGIGDNGGSGEKITLTWKIITGPLEGRLIWQDILHGYNVPGEKGDKTRDIAARQLSAVCHAVGKLAPKDTEELHHIPCEVSYGPQRKNPQYDEVKAVKPLNGGAASGGGGGAATRSSFGGGKAPPANNSALAAASGGGWPKRA